MGIKRHKPEEIVTKLRQVEVLCGQPVEFILDEACNAKAALSNLIDDLTLVRGLSARVHLAAQAESQIVTTWGRDAAKTLDAVTDLKQIMGTNSPEEGKRPASLL